MYQVRACSRKITRFNKRASEEDPIGGIEREKYSMKARETRGEDNHGAQGIADLAFGKDCKSLQRVGVRRRMERRRFQDGRRPLLSRSWSEQDLRVEEPMERRVQKFLRAIDLQADMTEKDDDRRWLGYIHPLKLHAI